MIKIKQREWFIIGGLILAVFFMHLPVAYTSFYHELSGQPEASNGSINLSTVNPSDDKIYLDGQWEFYSRVPSCFLKIPSTLLVVN